MSKADYYESPDWLFQAANGQGVLAPDNAAPLDFNFFPKDKDTNEAARQALLQFAGAMMTNAYGGFGNSLGHGLMAGATSFDKYRNSASERNVQHAQTDLIGSQAGALKSKQAVIQSVADKFRKLQGGNPMPQAPVSGMRVLPEMGGVGGFKPMGFNPAQLQEQQQPQQPQQPQQEQQQGGYPLDINDISQLKIHGIDMLPEYRFATEGYNVPAGSYQIRNGKREYFDKVPEGMRIGADNGLDLIPRYSQNNAVIKGQEALATERGKASLDVLDPTKYVTNGRPLTRLEVADQVDGGRGAIASGMSGSGGQGGQGLKMPVTGGKYDHLITDQLLDGFKHTESRGNRHALNDGSQAMGAYQFLPSTARMISKMGYDFSPFDEKQARGATRFYLNYLLDKTGGNLDKAIAAYGGFVRKDPSEYIASVKGNGGGNSVADSGAIRFKTPTELAQEKENIDVAGAKQKGIDKAIMESTQKRADEMAKQAQSHVGLIDTISQIDTLINSPDSTLGRDLASKGRMTLHDWGLYEDGTSRNTFNLIKLGSNLVLAHGSLGTGVSTKDAEIYDKAAGDFTKAQSNPERLGYIKIMYDIAKKAIPNINTALEQYNKTGTLPSYRVPERQTFQPQQAAQPQPQQSSQRPFKRPADVEAAIDEALKGYPSKRGQ